MKPRIKKNNQNLKMSETTKSGWDVYTRPYWFFYGILIGFAIGLATASFVLCLIGYFG